MVHHCSDHCMVLGCAAIKPSAIVSLLMLWRCGAGRRVLVPRLLATQCFVTPYFMHDVSIFSIIYHSSLCNSFTLMLCCLCSLRHETCFSNIWLGKNELKHHVSEHLCWKAYQIQLEISCFFTPNFIILQATSPCDALSILKIELSNIAHMSASAWPPRPRHLIIGPKTVVNYRKNNSGPSPDCDDHRMWTRQPAECRYCRYCR